MPQTCGKTWLHCPAAPPLIVQLRDFGLVWAVQKAAFTPCSLLPLLLRNSNLLLPCFTPFSTLKRLLTPWCGTWQHPCAPSCSSLTLAVECVYFGSGCVQSWLISPSDGLFIKLLLPCCVEVLGPRPSPQLSAPPRPELCPAHLGPG